MRRKKSIKFFKKIWHFLSHHNAPVIAFELAIFAGIILVFAAPDNQDNQELGIMNYELGNNNIAIEQYSDEAMNSEQGTVNSEQTGNESDREETAEAELTILNVHSAPQAGENWQVFFETKGIADLTISPIDQPSIDDLDFVSLKCGEEERTAQILDGDVIFYSDWQCQGTGEVTHFVSVAGHHALQFQFGDQTGYAYNSPDDTGWKDPSADEEDYTAWTTFFRVYASDNSYGTENFPGDMSDCYNFGFDGTIPSGSTINGIEVNVEGKSGGGSDVIEFELSWDGGPSYTSENKQKTYTLTEGYQTFGSPTDTWGRTWSEDEFDNANFRVRVEAISGMTEFALFYLDHIQVKVYYTEAAVPSYQPRPPGISPSGGGFMIF